MVALRRNLQKYGTQDVTFPSTREAKFLDAIATARETADIDAFTGAVVDFDQVTKLDNWKTAILLKIKRTLEADEEDLT